MNIVDGNKRVGMDVGFNTSIYHSVVDCTLPCVQVCMPFTTPSEDINALSSLKPHVYLHSNVRTNISNTASNSNYVVPPSIKHLNQLLNLTPHFHASVVVHYGARGHLNKTLESLSFLNIPNNTPSPYPILLENAAGEGTELGVTLDEIRYVFERISSPKIGMCLDTCHAFGAGYHVENTEHLNHLLDELDNIAPRRLRMIHLNDSQYTCGSRRDRHASLGCGYIWSSDYTSLDFLLEYGSEHSLDFILETPQPSICLSNLYASPLMRLKRRH